MILLVGYGYWGKNLARNFSKELTAVCDSDTKKLEIVTFSNKKIQIVIFFQKSYNHYFFLQ